MDLLDNLLTNGFLDFGDDGTTSNQEANIIASDCGNTILFGVTLILPLMTESLLELPALSDKYYKLLGLLCEIYPEKVLQLSMEHLQAFNYSLRLAMNAGAVQAAQALDAVCELADGVKDFKENEKNDPRIVEFLNSIIRPVIDTAMIYSGKVNEIGQSSGKTFYALINCNEAVSRSGSLIKA